MHAYKISIVSMRSMHKCAYLKEKITFKEHCVDIQDKNIKCVIHQCKTCNTVEITHRNSGLWLAIEQ